MDSVAAVRPTESAEPARAVHGPLSLSALHPGDRGIVQAVGIPGRALTALERRLLELGFSHGEHIEVIAEARPGRDPFVVRLGATALALRRREAESVWISPRPPARP
ncbi:MAG TPA: FeoA family protein [Steroidobacteraceae bacterium]|nr:FeoA family protein [Steroidobacteraceae bacterium]